MEIKYHAFAYFILMFPTPFYSKAPVGDIEGDYKYDCSHNIKTLSITPGLNSSEKSIV